MMKGGNKMKLTRIETAELLGVSEKYLCPSNFHSVQEGAKEKGYNLISMTGRGKNAIYEIESIYQDLEGEEWKNFPLAPEYQVSNFGRIKHPKGGILEGTINKGYVRTRIKNLGQFQNHRAVMLTFEPIENAEKYVVDHINGIRNDNRLENLRWVFQRENMIFCDENNTELKEILAKLIQKYGYKETKQRLESFL